MQQVNFTRVLLGGLLAGLVINAGEFLAQFAFASDMQQWLQRYNLPEPGNAAITLFVISGFAIGIVAVWLYASIRSRYGAGVKTAVIAGVATAVLAIVFPNFWFRVMGLLDNRLFLLFSVWGLVEYTIATVAGAWLYKEEGAPAAGVRAPGMGQMQPGARV